MTQTFDQNWIIQDTQMIIRPPRSPYNIKKIKQQLDVAYELKENQSYEFLNFQNKKGQDITGTLFIPENPKEGNPCVVFAHGNSTNQMFPAFPYAHYFYEKGIYVFTFDFSFVTAELSVMKSSPSSESKSIAISSGSSKSRRAFLLETFASSFTAGANVVGLCF